MQNHWMLPQNEPHTKEHTAVEKRSYIFQRGNGRRTQGHFGSAAARKGSMQVQLGRELLGRRNPSA